MSRWKKIHCAPEGEEVMTCIADGGEIRNEQSLVRQGRLWFFPGKDLYVYYSPTHWRELEPSEKDR